MIFISYGILVIVVVTSACEAFGIIGDTFGFRRLSISGMASANSFIHTLGARLSSLIACLNLLRAESVSWGTCDLLIYPLLPGRGLRSLELCEELLSIMPVTRLKFYKSKVDGVDFSKCVEEYTLHDIIWIYMM